MDRWGCAEGGDRLEPPAEHFVFAYGSLINPASARRTLPGLDARFCLPARCHGLRRTFGVAFPNDGSQPDKWYADDRGNRPPWILFANLEEDADVAANGILLPVSRSGFERLAGRELRYGAVDITERVRLWNGARPPLPVTAFLGRAEFTRATDVAAGLVPFAYLELIRTGGRLWDHQVPGFAGAYAATTAEPPHDRVRSLTRFDRADAGVPGLRA